MKIIGITRFSLVASNLGSYKQTRNTPSREEAKRKIFNHKRLKTRFALFQAITLPSIASMARNHNEFSFVIVTSDDLPLRWQFKLWRATRKFRWCRVVYAHTSLSLQDALRSAVTPIVHDGEIVMTFRIDDDDALSRHYLPAAINALRTSAPGTVLSFDDGLYTARKAADSYIITPRTRPLIAIGLGLVSEGGPNFRTIYDLGDHTQIKDQVRNLTGGPYWLRTVHQANDSGVKLRPTRPVPGRVAHDIVRLHFDLDPCRALSALQ